MRYEITEWLKRLNTWAQLPNVTTDDVENVERVIERAELDWNAHNDNTPSVVQKFLTDADLRAQAVGDWGASVDAFLAAQ